jgi:hypothetical protein
MNFYSTTKVLTARPRQLLRVCFWRFMRVVNNGGVWHGCGMNGVQGGYDAGGKALECQEARERVLCQCTQAGSPTVADTLANA